MSKLIMWNLMTLDGFFEGKKSWDLGFHKFAWGKELEELSLTQLRSADALVFGRVTYEGMAAYFTKDTGEVAEFMNSLPKVVFSRTLKRADWANTTLIKDNAAVEIAKLKKKGNGNLFVFGSANLSADFTEHGLFDEYRVCLVPVLLGRGRKLFERESRLAKLKLTETRPLSNGSVIVRYEPAKNYND